MTKRALSFNPNHIFVDTNVLVGGYSGDAKFQKDDDCLHYLFSLTGKRLYISSLSVTQLISVYQKKKSNEEITAVVRDLQHRFNIIDFTAKDIDAALKETGADIEDNVQFVLAKKQNRPIPQHHAIVSPDTDPRRCDLPDILRQDGGGRRGRC